MSVDALTSAVIAAGLGVGFVFGAVAQQTRFCTLGAVADLVGMGDATRLRMWALAIAVATGGTTLVVGSGLIDVHATIYTAPRLRWLSHLVGGACFGVGMVLASGCGSKTLIRLGGGSLKALVVALCLALGALITLRGALAVVRVQGLEQVAIDLPSPQDLPSLLAVLGGSGTPTNHILLSAGLGVAALLGGWALFHPLARQRETLLGGIGVGLAVVAGWLATGWLGFLPEHPETLTATYLATNTGRMESLSFVAPQAYALDLLMFWSDTGRHVTFGIASAAGVVLGAAASAWRTREFRWEGFRDTADLARHMLGGLLMGFGGITGLGCTIGQGISGVSTLSLGSWITLAAMLAASWATMQWQYRHDAG